MPKPTPGDYERAGTVADPFRQFFPDTTVEIELETAIAATCAEQRNRIETAVTALSDHDNVRLELQDVLRVIRATGCDACKGGVIHNAWGEDGVSVACEYCQRPT